ncbi:MAG: phage tail tape measure protein, partial [Huintestinicola sp.]
MSADGSLIFDTGLDNSGFDKGISLLKKAAVASAAAITVAFTTAAGAAVNVGSSFTSAMSQVSATMGITRISEDYAMLAEAAKDMGESTKFSASQAGEALNYLALAGYDAEKSISALPTVLDVAAAGGIDLAYASDMITDSMSALGMSMDQLDNFADQLARTSQKSNTSVSQLGEAILTVGGTAKTLNGGVAELNTMLGLIADNGIKGAEGGTALRNIILSLSAPTNTAAKALSELNISAFDSEGKFRDLSTVFGELNTALEPLGDDRKNQILNDIFNKVDLKAVNALLGTSAERFKELSGYINDCDGAASAMAQTMSDNLQGDMDKLKSALEGLGITAFEKFETPLRTSVQEVTTVIGRLNESLDGELGTKIAEVADKFGDLAVRAAEFAVDEGLPKLLDGLEWLCDNADELGAAAQTAGAMVIAYKGLTTAASAANTISAFASAASGAAAAQGALNIAINACPWALAITLAVGAGVAIRDFIEDLRDNIGWEGEIKEAYNDTNEELARRIGYLDELNKKDSWSGYKEASDGLAETNNQLEENNKKLAELYNKRKAINIQR